VVTCGRRAHMRRRCGSPGGVTRPRHWTAHVVASHMVADDAIWWCGRQPTWCGHPGGGLRQPAGSRRHHRRVHALPRPIAELQLSRTARAPMSRGQVILRCRADARRTVRTDLPRRLASAGRHAVSLSAHSDDIGSAARSPGIRVYQPRRVTPRTEPQSLAPVRHGRQPVDCVRHRSACASSFPAGVDAPA